MTYGKATPEAWRDYMERGWTGFASFACDGKDCGWKFAEHLPPMYADLPACPACKSGQAVQLIELLGPEHLGH